MTSAPPLTTAHLPRRPRPGPPAGRGWAVVGAIAGLAGVVGIQASLSIDAVYNKKSAGDAELITERLEDFVPNLLTLHFAMMTASLLLLVFAAGLRRRLQGQAPAGSLLPDVAAGGLLLTAVATLMGVAFSTEIIFAHHRRGPVAMDVGVRRRGRALDRHRAVAVGRCRRHRSSPSPSRAIRHAAAPRWIGWAAAVLGGLTTIAGMSPLQ